MLSDEEVFEGVTVADYTQEIIETNATYVDAGRGAGPEAPVF